jgi:predicted aldo/keto reductase-like oxidoreductase
MHLLKEWTSLLKLHNDDPMSVCLSFVSQRLELEQVVLGVQSIKQLKQVIASYSKIVDTDRYDSIISVDDDLVNPTNWTMR